MKKLSVIYLAFAGLVVVVLAQAGRQARVIKPDLGDTIKASIYADNWFQLYINGKQVAVDPIDFLPHNVVTLDILPQYPMAIAVMAMDNAAHYGSLTLSPTWQSFCPQRSAPIFIAAGKALASGGVFPSQHA
jgi:hypothetical protein